MSLLNLFHKRFFQKKRGQNVCPVLSVETKLNHAVPVYTKQQQLASMLAERAIEERMIEKKAKEEVQKRISG